MTSRATVQPLSLESAAKNLLEECRMVLPGVQALFGFQFVAVFDPVFKDLSPGERLTHLVALVLVACAAALVMSPAALHRRTEPRSVSSTFLEWSSRLLMISMVPLACGTALDVYLVSRLITNSRPASAVIAAGVLSVFSLLWFWLPTRFPRGERATERTSHDE